jgi:hypothetical protein
MRPSESSATGRCRIVFVVGLGVFLLVFIAGMLTFARLGDEAD